MSPFSILTVLLLIFSSAAATILGSSAKRHKIHLSNQVKKNDELELAVEQAYIAKEEEEHKHSDRINTLEKEVSNLLQEKESAFEEGKKATKPDIEEAKNEISSVKRVAEQFENDIKKANDTIATLKQKVGNIDIERHKILLEELNDNINWGQSQILDFLEGHVTTEELAFPLNVENNFILGFDDAISKTGLVIEKHYLSEKFKISKNDDEEKTLYVILFSSNGNVVLIDGKFSAFIEQNIEHLDSRNPDVQQQMRTIITERADFLSNKEFLSTLKSTLEELDNVRSVNTIQTCMYLPSELAIAKLTEAIGDFSSITSPRSVTTLSPSGFINVLQNCKFLYEIEQEVIKYQILADIISDFHINDDEQGKPTDIEEDENYKAPTPDDTTTDIKQNLADITTAETTDDVPEMLGDLGMKELNLDDIAGDTTKHSPSNELPDHNDNLDDLNLDHLDPEEQDANSHDLNLDAPAPTNSQISPETNDELELGDLDLDDLDLGDAQPSSETKDEANNDELELGDLDLDDLDLGDAQPNSETKDEANNDELELGDLDLDDLDLGDAQPNSETNDEKNDDSLELDDLDFDDLALDEAQTNDEDQNSVSAEQSDADSAFDDFDLDGFLDEDENADSKPS